VGHQLQFETRILGGYQPQEGRYGVSPDLPNGVFRFFVSGTSAMDKVVRRELL
jgi:hypothetical protein